MIETDLPGVRPDVVPGGGDAAARPAGDEATVTSPAAARAQARSVGLWLALLVAIALLRTVNRYLIDVANQVPTLFTPKLIEEATGSLSFGLFLPLLFIGLRWIRGVAPRSLRLLAHGGLFLGLAGAHTTTMLVSRQLCFTLAGLSAYGYAPTRWRYLMELPTQLFFYALVALGLWLFDGYRAGRRRELEAARLQSALSQARLESLRLQLNPHFLFNTLNAVSELMYERPRAADEMLSRIGDLLRATLSATTQQHRLADEWRLLGLYLDIQRARFGDGLAVTVQADPALDRARVPFLVLQPLVENAIEHGGDGLTRRVTVTAAREGGRLVLGVRDFGSAGGVQRGGHGIGLGNVRTRLEYLHGGQAGVRLEPADGGGSIVRVWLPLIEGAAA